MKRGCASSTQLGIPLVVFKSSSYAQNWNELLNDVEFEGLAKLIKLELCRAHTPHAL